MTEAPGRGHTGPPVNECATFLSPPSLQAKNGVMDVLAVKESAMQLAVDAAITVLRVDLIIMSKQAGGPKAPGQGGPGA